MPICSMPGPDGTKAPVCKIMFSLFRLICLLNMLPVLHAVSLFQFHAVQRIESMMIFMILSLRAASVYNLDVYFYHYYTYVRITMR